MEAQVVNPSSTGVSSRPIGRDDDLARMELLWARAMQPAPCMVVVAGEAGIGKSTLVDTFAQGLGDAEVVIGGCHELGGDSLPWAPLVDIIQQLVVRHGVGTVAELAGPCHRELGRLVPRLAVPRTDGDHARQAMPDVAGGGHARLVDAVTTLLRGLASRRPLAVVFEDLHWADRSTQAVLPAIANALADRPAMVVATLREDEPGGRGPYRRLAAELVRGDRGEWLALQPLTRAQQARQLTGILGVPPTRRLLDDVWERAAGNPFFAEELVAHGGELPVTVRELLLGRLLALPAPTRRRVTVAALQGRTIDPHVVAAVMEVDAAGLDTLLAPAVDASVVVTRPDGSMAIRHALLVEVAARMVLPTAATRLHTRIADVLDAGVGDDQPAGRVMAVARHRAAAGDAVRGLPAALAAGRAAADMLAFPDALRFHERALRSWDQVDAPEVLAGCRRHKVLSAAAEMAHLAGEPGPAASLARAALAEVDEVGDPARASLLHERLGRYLWMDADGVGAKRSYERAVQLAEAADAAPVVARARSGWAQVLMLEGDHAQALLVAQQALREARRTGERGIEGHALNNRGVVRALLGEVDEGLDDLAVARDIAEELLDDVDDVLRAIVNRAHVLYAVGRLSEAAETACEGIAVAERLGLERRKGVWSRCDTADVLLTVGAVGDAERLLAEAELFEPSGIDLLRTRLVRGRVAMARGDLDGADVALRDAWEMAADVIDEQLVAPLGAAVVDLRTRQDRPGEALDAAERTWQRLRLREPSFATPLAAAAVAAGVDAAAGSGDTATVDAWLRRCEDVAAGVAMPPVRAWVLTARAHASRLAEPPEPAPWAASAAAWEDMGAVGQAAHVQWRQAAALLVRGDPSNRAAALLRRAHDTCRDSGLVWLDEQVQRLARRARVCLDDEASSSTGDPFGLTARERDVLELVAAGLTNRQVGEHLFIGHRTVATHVSNVLAKLSATSRSEAAAIAVREGLLD